MLTFTDGARRSVRAYMAQGYVENPALRIAVSEGASPIAPEYDISLVEDGDGASDDFVFDAGEFRVVVDAGSVEQLEGVTVDYVDDLEGSGFRILRSAPTSGARATGPLADRVREVLEQQINPAIAAHGGHITLEDVQDGVAYLEMSGGCQGCGMARVTLRQGVERMLREAIPEIVEIRDVTDHASGTNPYYQP